MERITTAHDASSNSRTLLRSQRYQRLTDELEATFLEEGFLHLSTAEIAKRLRCSKQTLYALASSRDALFELIIENWLARIRSRGDAAVRDAKDPVSAIIGYLDVTVDIMRNARAQFIRDLDHFPPGRRSLQRHQHQRVAGLEMIISRGIKEGCFERLSAKLMAEVMLHAVALMFDPNALERCDVSPSRAYAELYHVFINGLIPRNGKPHRITHAGTGIPLKLPGRRNRSIR